LGRPDRPATVKEPRTAQQVHAARGREELDADHGAVGRIVDDRDVIQAICRAESAEENSTQATSCVRSNLVFTVSSAWSTR
jgi:hypothetical protein